MFFLSPIMAGVYAVLLIIIISGFKKQYYLVRIQVDNTIITYTEYYTHAFPKNEGHFFVEKTFAERFNFYTGLYFLIKERRNKVITFDERQYKILLIHYKDLKP